jgi:hypothetical protein
MEQSGTEPARLHHWPNGCWVRPCVEGEALFRGIYTVIFEKKRIKSDKNVAQ